MLPITFLAVLILVTYLLLIYLYSRGFQGYPSYAPQEKSEARISATILIPCRNPSLQIYELLLQLNQQLANTQSYEILIINDFSDNDIHLNLQKNCKVINLKNHKSDLSKHKNNKKEAIALGVSLAQYDYIVCLDSDVSLSENWWIITSNFIQDKNPQFAAGLHRYKFENNWLGKFLVLEQDILTATSIAALQLRIPTMCNGANMLFSKQAFDNVRGYEGLYHTIGGDDLFLYHRIYKRYPNDTLYIKNIENAVYSAAPKSINELLKQRRRWISKTKHYENVWVNIQGGVILGANLISIISFPFLPTIILIKSIIDIFYIRKICDFYKTRYSIFPLMIQGLVYPIYILAIVLTRPKIR